MPKLYYSPISCGAASFIAMVGAGLQFEVEQVYLDCHRTASDADFYTINPKGNVPCLVLDDGTILNENISVLQYIADQNPNSVAPEYGSLDRYLLVNTLGFLASEVHATFTQIFRSARNNDSLKADHLLTLEKHFVYLENYLLKDRRFLVGDKFSIADAYLYVMLLWEAKAGFDLWKFQVLQAYRTQIGELREVLVAEQKMESLAPPSG